MNSEIINVGTELLLGNIVNLNSKYLSEELAALGINVYYQTSVGDNATRLKKVLANAVSRSNIIIITGGLGPTPDDLTKETVAGALNIPLVEDDITLTSIKRYFDAKGVEMPESNRKQALCPKGAVIFANDNGTAPGLALSSGNQHIIMLPGPPSELIPMFEKHVSKYLAGLSDNVIISKNVRIFGIGESEVAERVADMLDMRNPTVAPYAKSGEVELRVTARAENADIASEMCRKTADEIQRIFGEFIYTTEKANLQETVVDMLIANGVTVSTAESCTAGMLSSAIADVPGASQVLRFGAVTYVNEIKHSVLGVGEDTILKYGAVSRETAIQMALGARSKGGSDLGVGITGVAGPQPSEDKPVGLVYIALTDGRRAWVKEMHAEHKAGDRAAIRELAVKNALDLIRRYMLHYPDVPGGEAVSEEELAAESEASAAVVAESLVMETDREKNDVEETVTESEDGGNEKWIYSQLFGSDDSMSEAKDVKTHSHRSNANVHFKRVPSVKKKYFGRFWKRINVPALSAERGQKIIKISNDSTMAENRGSGGFKNFLKNLVPWKGDRTGEIIRKSVFLVALSVFLGSAIYLIYYFTGQQHNSKIISDARIMWEDNGDKTLNSDGIYNRFAFLIKQNSDVKAWIKIDGTNVNNPVYQTDNNDYYLDHNMAHEQSRYGALFIDSSNVVRRNRVSKNITIYGHNTQDGSMFANLLKYQTLNFYKEHPVIEFDTLYREGEYKIFAVLITNANAEQDNGFSFNYRKDNFTSEEEFINWINAVKQRSIINTGIDVVFDDEMITLSTCCYHFTEARLVVMARRVRVDESAGVNVSAAVYNPQPLYPQAWYDKKGIAKPDFTSSINTESGTSSGTATS